MPTQQCLNLLAVFEENPTDKGKRFTLVDR